MFTEDTTMSRQAGIVRKLIYLSIALPLTVAGRVDSVARGDVLELTGGGRLHGQWLNADAFPIEVYEFRTEQGGRLVLNKALVRGVTRVLSAAQQYPRAASQYDNDVPGQWALAQWCREHGLKEQRRIHLRRILELEPNHAGARLALGYSQVRGRWLTQEESMREQGYVQYRGRWRLSQQIELMEAERRRDLAERQWYRQLMRWRRELGTADAAQASEWITAINDAHATRALAVLLCREQLRLARLLYIRALANIGTPPARDILVGVVLADTDLEVAHVALDQLAAVQSPAVYQKFLEALQDEDNAVVNRAGFALGRLGAKSAIGSLIDALVTYHRIALDPRGVKGDPRTIVVAFKNLDVHSALVELTGISGYGFDEQAWKQWRYLQVGRMHAEAARSVEVRRTK